MSSTDDELRMKRAAFSAKLKVESVMFWVVKLIIYPPDILTVQ